MRATGSHEVIFNHVRVAAEHAAVWARSDDNPPLVGTWLVPGDSPGITVVKSVGSRRDAGHRQP